MEYTEDHKDGVQPWGTRSFAGNADIAGDWGITPENRERVAALLSKYPELNANDYQLRLSLPALRRLVKIIGQDGLTMDTLNEGIDTYFNRKGQEVSQGRKRILELMRLLLPGAFQTGKQVSWGKTEEEALSRLFGRYNIDLKYLSSEPDTLRLLQLLSGRVLRVYSRAGADLYYRDNPFAVIGSAGRYELLPESDGAGLYDTEQNRMIAHIPVLDNEVSQLEFNRFCAWLMFLSMTTDSSGRIPPRFSVRFPGPPAQGDEETAAFAYPVMEEFRATNDRFSIEIQIDAIDTPDSLEMIGVFFSGSHNYRVAKAYRITRGQDFIARFEAEGFFDQVHQGDASLKNTVRSIGNADFLKVFIVRSPNEDNIDPATYRTFPGLPDVPDFYRLITLSDEELVATYTVGLAFADQSESVQPFNGRWILVAGTGDGKLSIEEQAFCAALGRLLAQNGYGLMGGGWPGVDEQIATSFAELLIDEKQNVSERLVQLLEPGQKSAYRYGALETIRRNDWNNDVAERADCLVMIGGKGGTYDAFESFQRIGKPVIPVAGTGGDAKKAFRRLKKDNYFDYAAWSYLSTPVNRLEIASEMAAQVMVLLLELPPRPQP